jgi:hypothetical protein
LSAIQKPDKQFSEAGRKSNLTKSAAPASRSQNHNQNDDDLPDDGIKSERISVDEDEDASPADD